MGRRRKVATRLEHNPIVLVSAGPVVMEPGVHEALVHEVVVLVVGVVVVEWRSWPEVVLAKAPVEARYRRQERYGDVVRVASVGGCVVAVNHGRHMRLRRLDGNGVYCCRRWLWRPVRVRPWVLHGVAVVGS